MYRVKFLDLTWKFLGKIEILVEYHSIFAILVLVSYVLIFDDFSLFLSERLMCHIGGTSRKKKVNLEEKKYK